MSIEAVLRKQQYKQRVATVRERLRQGVEVQVFDDRLNAGGDSDRKSSEVVAIAGGESITWGQVRQRLTAAGQDPGPAARREQLEDYIDSRIMLQKAQGRRVLNRMRTTCGVSRNSKNLHWSTSTGPGFRKR